MPVEIFPVQVKDPFCSYMATRRLILQNCGVHHTLFLIHKRRCSSMHRKGRLRNEHVYVRSVMVKHSFRLFKTNKVVSSRFIKISSINI